MKINISKAELDKLLVDYGGQPVGSGYTDIIVKRENYKAFVDAILSNGIKIYSITWWEYCEFFGIEPKYGMGGPQSHFYPGWFAEICSSDDTDFDEVDVTKDNQATKNDIIRIVENRTFHFFNDTFSFQNYEPLTPAFWLIVPNDWVNTQD
jgi:hypothetical protein